jgi:hypothetical protein
MAWVSGSLDSTDTFRLLIDTTPFRMSLYRHCPVPLLDHTWLVLSHATSSGNEFAFLVGPSSLSKVIGHASVLPD